MNIDMGLDMYPAIAIDVDTDMVDGGAGEVACEKKLTIGVYNEALQVRVERVF